MRNFGSTRTPAHPWGRELWQSQLFSRENRAGSGRAEHTHAGSQHRDENGAKLNPKIPKSSRKKTPKNPTATRSRQDISMEWLKLALPKILDYLFHSKIQLQTHPGIFRPDLFFFCSILGLFNSWRVFSTPLIPGWFFLKGRLDPAPGAPSATEKVYPYFPIFP